MESGSTPVDELVAMLEAADVVDVRMALYRATEEDGGGWRVGFGEVLLGAATAPVERTWTYRDDVFVQRRLPGQVAADLVREKPQPVSGLQVSAAATPPTCIFQRLAGQVRYNQATLPWPCTVWQLNRQGSSLSSRPRAALVGDGPAFLNADAAFASFFHQAAAENGLAQPHELWRIVRLDRRGWIHRVIIGPDALTVTVKGTALAGTKAELTTPDSHQIRPVGTTGKVRLKLPRGLIAGTLLMLRTGDDWLDFRYFPATGPGGGDTSVVWDLPGADAEVLIAGGETEYVEFKREVPAGESRKKMLKTVAAFASGQGGTVLIGVEDDAQVVGVDATNLDELMRTVRSMIRDRIEPDPPVTVRAVPVSGKTVLLVEVAAGGRMFGYDREKPEFYLRRGASTRPARMREIDVGFGAASPQLW